VIEQPASIFADESERILRIGTKDRVASAELGGFDRELLDRATIDVGRSEGDTTVRAYVLAPAHCGAQSFISSWRVADENAGTGSRAID